MGLTKLQRSMRLKLWPELAFFPMPDRQEALREAEQRVWRRADFLALFACGAAIGVIGPFLLPVIGVPIGHRGWVRSILQFVYVLSALGAAWRYRRHTRRNLRRILNARYGPTLCINCGYELHQSNSTTCPECGAAAGSAKR